MEEQHQLLGLRPLHRLACLPPHPSLQHLHRGALHSRCALCLLPHLQVSKDKLGCSLLRISSKSQSTIFTRICSILNSQGPIFARPALGSCPEHCRDPEKEKTQLGEILEDFDKFSKNRGRQKYSLVKLHSSRTSYKYLSTFSNSLEIVFYIDTFELCQIPKDVVFH